MPAALAGLRASSLYNHFSTKDRPPFVRLAPMLERLEGATAEDLIRAFVRLVVAEVGVTPGLMKLMLIEIVDLRGAHLPALVYTRPTRTRRSRGRSRRPFSPVPVRWVEFYLATRSPSERPRLTGWRSWKVHRARNETDLVNTLMNSLRKLKVRIATDYNPLDHSKRRSDALICCSAARR